MTDTDASAASSSSSPSGSSDRSIDPAKVDRLLERVQREVDEGLSPAVSIAVAHHGEVVVDATYGAPAGSRFLGFSASKALVAAAIWRMIDEGMVDIHASAATYIPEFATNGKDVVTVEQLLTHTGGFPWAPLGPNRWATTEGRREAFSRWRLTLEPGSAYVYHPTAGHWVLGEILAEVTGMDHADAIEELVTAPLGLPRLLGIPLDQQDGILDAVGVGTPPTADEMEEAFGISIDVGALIPPDVAIGALTTLNDPDARRIGVPGGGGVFRAQDLALLYQGLMANPANQWSHEALVEGTQRVRMNLPDIWGVPAGRTLGLVVAGDDGLSHRRGMGRMVSPRAFGHNGAGGQLAFGDPDTGLSVGYLTAGLDQHMIRQQRRDTAIASLAADLLAD
ncbi:serine hydrolase domain-containing protein [Aquihabitans sp. McL0605]|uniref:serine hydrolase domain-containing protein n=1 Tax=Aquihabitans sp. McL0605 TaxID=3415671 RepID=UPI003CF17A9B